MLSEANPDERAQLYAANVEVSRPHRPQAGAGQERGFAEALLQTGTFW